jgi:hypothetical protein
MVKDVCLSSGRAKFSIIFERHRFAKYTSSRREGRILRIRKPSEKRSSTFVSPFIKEIFSSLDFVAKFERSRKFSVDIGNDEKNACEGKVSGDMRPCGCRVISMRSKAVHFNEN